VSLTLGRGEQAVADLEEATREEPNAARFFHLARAYQLANNTKAAAKAMRQAKAMKLKPEHLHPVERVVFQQLHRDLELQ
jgi:hypothetical protein